MIKSSEPQMKGHFKNDVWLIRVGEKKKKKNRHQHKYCISYSKVFVLYCDITNNQSIFC